MKIKILLLKERYLVLSSNKYLVVSKAKHNTKENSSESIKNAFMYCCKPNNTSWAEATPNSEYIKSVSLAVTLI